MTWALFRQRGSERIGPRSIRHAPRIESPKQPLLGYLPLALLPRSLQPQFEATWVGGTNALMAVRFSDATERPDPLDHREQEGGRQSEKEHTVQRLERTHQLPSGF